MTDREKQLRDFTESELHGELARREDERLAKELAEKKAREVEIVCPECNGKGKVPRYDTAVTTGEANPWNLCTLCKSRGWIVAYRRAR